MIGYCRVAPGDIAQGAGSLYLFALAQPVEEALVDLEPHELKVFRTHGLRGQSYQAVYRDAIGEFIYIPDERLRKQPSPGTMPWGEYSWEYK